MLRDRRLALSQSSLLNGLAASWRLDTVPGLDDLGVLNLSATNSPTLAAGPINSQNATAFVRASNQFLSVASTSRIVFGNISFTVACWVFLASKPASSTMGIVGRYGASGAVREWNMAFNSTANNFRFDSVGTGAVEDIVQATTFGSPALSTWHGLIGWYDAQAQTNNIQVGVLGGSLTGANSTAHTVGIQTTTTALTIGQISGSSAAALDGRVAGVSLWNRMLTEKERMAWFHNGAALNYPFLGA